MAYYTLLEQAAIAQWAMRGRRPKSEVVEMLLLVQIMKLESIPDSTQKELCNYLQQFLIYTILKIAFFQYHASTFTKAKSKI